MFLLLFFSGCKKDRLTGEYDQIQGEYVWVYTKFFKRNCVLCQNGTSESYEPGSSEFTAGIRFDDKGKVYFIIDDEVFVKRPYKVIEKEKMEGFLYLTLKVDVSKKDLDIDDKINLRFYGGDTLIIKEFPGSGYDEDIRGENYFIRIK